MAARKPTTDVDVIDDGVLDVKEFINKLVPGLANELPQTWDELALLNDGEIIEFQGSPWEVINKAELVDVPFMIADVRYSDGSYATGFVSVMVITEAPLPNHENNLYVINDGSTGVKEQVIGMIRQTGRKSGIKCSRGLRASEYKYQQTDFDGQPMGPEIPATTYYVA